MLAITPPSRYDGFKSDRLARPRQAAIPGFAGKMTELVECHSGYEYGERPVALQWQGQRLEVIRILDRWRSPGGKSFRVCAGDEQIFELHYDEREDEWRINQK
jgi:hypothetical protein